MYYMCTAVTYVMMLCFSSQSRPDPGRLYPGTVPIPQICPGREQATPLPIHNINIENSLILTLQRTPKNDHIFDEYRLTTIRFLHNFTEKV